MSVLNSFRLRLLLGLVVGAMGLLAITHLVTVLFFHNYRIRLHPSGLVILVSVALLFVVFGLWQIRKGFSPFEELRTRLSAYREGRGRRLDGAYPTEVQPLVNDLNALLAHREGVVERALAKAGDLAHGLKTPLAILAQEAERARSSGNEELAAAIEGQVDRMRRQIDYHLAHARAAASGATPGARCLVSTSAEGLSRTLLRLHSERGVSIRTDVSPDHSFRGEIEDLDEMLGNLLDNACKWARSEVRVASAADGSSVVITVEDDGPGLDPSMWQSALQRGVRVDEAAPGSGLGLAIARDLAELYGGSISLGRSPAGGLRAELRLPA
ncbi:MAG: ATP-binding protein [Acidobacteriota bacterium]|nr:ATP-binding protein [Acidobacteriota bacterium]